jgi:hypothetical protein
VSCDHCGKRITDALDANTLWLEGSKNGKRVPLEPLRFTHKECNIAFERANPTPPRHIWMSDGLEVFLVNLTGNVHLKFKDAKRKANLMSRI